MGPKIYVQPNFERHSLYNKYIKIWTFRGLGAQNLGPKPKFFNSHVTWAPTSMYNQILKDLA